MQDNNVLLEIQSRPENVGLARVCIAAAASALPFTVAEVEEIKVAVSEAINNALVHGYGGDPHQVVRVEILVRGDELTVRVIDRGKGMADVAACREQASAGDDPERMGLGFAFMESFMDHVTVTSAPGQGTRVELCRRARQQPAASGAAAAG